MTLEEVHFLTEEITFKFEDGSTLKVPVPKKFQTDEVYERRLNWMRIQVFPRLKQLRDEND